VNFEGDFGVFLKVPVVMVTIMNQKVSVNWSKARLYSPFIEYDLKSILDRIFLHFVDSYSNS